MSAKVGEVVCVTGGSGFIGTWLVQLLLRRGYTVHATVQNLSNFPILFVFSLANRFVRYSRSQLFFGGLRLIVKRIGEKRSTCKRWKEPMSRASASSRSNCSITNPSSPPWPVAPECSTWRPPASSIGWMIPRWICPHRTRSTLLLNIFWFGASCAVTFSLVSVNAAPVVGPGG